LLFCALLSLSAGVVHAESSPEVLPASAYSDDLQLANVLWNRSPDIIEARAAVEQARSDLIRARTYPNPNLDFTWATIPVGRTNPPGLAEPLANVPNYTTGVAELVELGKRGPRQAAANADVERSEAQAQTALSDRFFVLLGRIGQIAASQQRTAVLTELVNAGQELLDLDRARAFHGEIADVELNRTEVEHARLVAGRDAALTDQASAQAECSTMVTAICLPFESGEAAHQFLAQAGGATLPTDWSQQAEEQRPDLSAQRAALRAAEQRATLAGRRKIPDVTVRLGYTYDSFLVSGNQRNSVALGVQLPIPAFDQGQAELVAALGERARAERIRESLIAAAPNRLAAAVHQRGLVLDRIRRMDDALDRARSVRDALGQAQRAGGTSQIEVLLARRAYQELVSERAALDADAFDIALTIRQALGLFPRPSQPTSIIAP
jgi:cobalt-zinc-cadmium efflux system outer membrane protein